MGDDYQAIKCGPRKVAEVPLYGLVYPNGFWGVKSPLEVLIRTFSFVFLGDGRMDFPGSFGGVHEPPNWSLLHGEIVGLLL